jgi:tRNA (guanine-N7-)-methyltransferase
VDWDAMYPNRDTSQVEILDIGCSFCGFLVSISPIVKELCLGIEIREKVANYSQQRILNLRKENPGQYDNIWAERSNAMMYLPNYFKKGQLKKITIMFADPNVKQRNHKKRIVGSSLVPIYAYILRKGGMLYTITDVEDLSKHMCKYLDESPLFRRMKDEEWKDDPLVAQMDKSEDAIHQKRKEKWIAIYEKIK